MEKISNMIILQVIWIDLILLFISSGCTKFAIMLYCISILMLGFMVLLNKEIISCLKSNDRVFFENLISISNVYPMGKITYVNIIMSTIIHSIICITLLDMPSLVLGIVILSIYRIKNEKDLEELLCQK